MTQYAVSITLTNEDKGYRFSEFTEEIESFDLRDDGTPDMGAIYRTCQREYGRCQSSTYMDTDSGTRRVGWYFLSRQRYEDTNEPYLRGAWVSVVEVEPETRRFLTVGPSRL